jgi:hypothetical protein
MFVEVIVVFSSQFSVVSKTGGGWVQLIADN